MTKNKQLFKLSSEAKKKYEKVTTASITTQLLMRGFQNTFIQHLSPMRPDLRMVGYAYTLRYAPSREDFDRMAYNNETNLQRIAVESIEEEDVLVIDARGEIGAASLGHILATRMCKRGAAGLVTDGALRDTPRFPELNLPTYYKASHATTSSLIHHPVDINVPIGCGGVLVMPGDVIVGDAEGVVIIPADVAEEVAHDTYEQDLLEEFLYKKIRDGSSIKGVYPPNEEMIREFKK